MISKKTYGIQYPHSPNSALPPVRMSYRVKIRMPWMNGIDKQVRKMKRKVTKIAGGPLKRLSWPKCLLDRDDLDFILRRAELAMGSGLNPQYVF